MRKDCESILNSNLDREILKLMREETALLVLMVRVQNDERRKQWEEEDREWRELEKAIPTLYDDTASGENE